MKLKGTRRGTRTAKKMLHHHHKFRVSKRRKEVRNGRRVAQQQTEEMKYSKCEYHHPFRHVTSHTQQSHSVDGRGVLVFSGIIANRDAACQPS